MKNGRVQVDNLSPPERLRPAPIPRDNYHPPAKPPINNDLERLASSLGHFNKGLQSFLAAREAKEKKEQTSTRMAEYQAWRASTTNQDQVEAIRTGKVPWYSDPYIGTVVRKDYGAMEAMSLAREVEAEIAGNKVPLHETDFNVEKYLLDKAAERVETLQHSEEVITSFRRGLDTLRSDLIERHQKARGLAAQSYFKDVASRQIDGALANAIGNGLTGQGLSDSIRQIYKDLGPRMKGGSLDLKYGEMDEVLLDVLDRKADDPRYSQAIEDLLTSPRNDVGNGMRLGSLADTQKHADKAKSILKKVMGARAAEEEKSLKAARLKDNIARFEGQNGSFAAIDDFEVPLQSDPSKSVSLSGAKQKKDAANTWLALERAKNGGKVNLDRELDVFMSNNVPHPEIVPTINSAFNGFLTMNVRDKDTNAPEQIVAIQEAAQLYNTLARKGYPYVQKHIDPKAVKFFETYTIMTKDGDFTPGQAALAMSRVYSDPNSIRDPALEARMGREIGEKVGQLDFKNWWPGGSISNNHELERRITNLAETYMQGGLIAADKAVEHAVERVRESSLFINGRAVFAVPGIQRGDEKHITTILDNFYEQNKVQLQDQGIESASDLTVVTFPNGAMYIGDNNRQGFPVEIYEGNADDPSTIRALQPRITPADIMKLRHADTNKNIDKAISDTVEKAQKRRDFEEHLPHNLIKKLFTPKKQQEQTPTIEDAP